MSPPSFQQDHHYHHHLHLAAVKHESPATTTTTTTAHTINNTNKCNNNVNPKMSPSSLKIHRDSRLIKKSSSTTICSSSASISSLVTSPRGGCEGSTNKPHNQQQQRGPVIIYTHSPKIIHTNPRDFMSLVQKLTGMSRNEGVAGPTARDAESSIANRGPAAPRGDQPDQKMVKAEGLISITAGNNSSNSTDDNENESSSVITDENCSTSTTGDAVGQLNPYVGPPFFDTPPPLLQTTCLPNFPPFMDGSSDMLCYSGDPAIGDYNYIDFNFPYNQIT
ncbi:hypothetical protein BVRB_5g110970 [Beta vulgaris subsp. vulgaris]|nr:hypothetical protein BVRB_5g110970 [Beta vulgaris subsp. vulgaris]